MILRVVVIINQLSLFRIPRYCRCRHRNEAPLYSIAGWRETGASSVRRDPARTSLYHVDPAPFRHIGWSQRASDRNIDGQRAVSWLSVVVCIYCVCISLSIIEFSEPERNASCMERLQATTQRSKWGILSPSPSFTEHIKLRSSRRRIHTDNYWYFAMSGWCLLQSHVRNRQN